MKEILETIIKELLKFTAKQKLDLIYKASTKGIKSEINIPVNKKKYNDDWRAKGSVFECDHSSPNGKK